MDEITHRAHVARHSCPYLSTKQAAYHLGLSPKTLKNMRTRDAGPRCRMHGRACRYHIDDIDAWSQARGRGPRYA
jgi:predicted DNA-binding transcriptional regulator AlpA